MINSKLIKILKSFDNTEWKNFKKFSSSTYFSKGRNFTPVLIIFDKFFPEFDDRNLTMEFIYKELFPGKPFNKNALNVILSGLTSAAESFIVISEIDNNPLSKNKLLNDYFLKKDLHNLFDTGLKNSFKKLGKDKIRNNIYWYYRYLYESQNINKIMKLDAATNFIDDKFKESEESLYYFILHEMCRFYQPALDPDFVFDTSIKQSYLFGFLLNEIGRNIDTCPQTLKCYYCYFKLILTKEREYFNKLYKSVKRIEDLFETSELRNFYITLLNYLCHSYNKNNTDLSEYFEIMNILVKRNLLQKSDGYIEPHSLLNMVNIMNKNNSDTVIEFIEKNYKKLDPEIRSSTYNYCIGVINLKNGNSEKSLEYLAKVEPLDYLMKLNADLYRFSLFYDLKYFENALALCDSVYEYLKYHKEISKEMKPLYLDFLNCYRQLIKIHSGNFTKFEVDEFKNLIVSKNNIFLKAWFLKKIDELEIK